jgi:hypothetical protein
MSNPKMNTSKHKSSRLSLSLPTLRFGTPLLTSRAKARKWFKSKVLLTKCGASQSLLSALKANSRRTNVPLPRTARELLANAQKTARPKVPEAVVIADETGRTVEVMHLVEVLPEPLKKK